MNCLEFRRAALANPHHPGHDALAHEAGCDSCARFYAALRRQEEVLYEAMNLPVPEGLSERVLLAAHGDWRTWFVPRRIMPALAASLVLAAALGAGWKLGAGASGPETLAAGIAEHVANEPKALAAAEAVSRATLVEAVRRSGGEMVQALGRTTYADHCTLPGGGKGEHLVFDTPEGKFTLILMPGKPIAHPVRVEQGGIAVSLMPAGAGSLALASGDRARLEAAENWARTNLRWPGDG